MRIIGSKSQATQKHAVASTSSRGLPMRRLTALVVSAGALALAVPAAASETEYTAPFPITFGFGSGDANRQDPHDFCWQPERTWGDCGGTYAADTSGAIAVSSWIRRSAYNTGGTFGARGDGFVGVNHKLTRPAKGVTVTAVVELRSASAAWVQDDPINQTSELSDHSPRASARVGVSVGRRVDLQTTSWSVLKPNTTSVATPGIYRLKYRLEPDTGGTIEPGDLRVGVLASVTSVSFSSGSFLDDAFAKDTGKFDSSADILVRNINVVSE